MAIWSDQSAGSNREENGFLPAWDVMRQKREQGLITEEEYLNWKYGVPME